MPTTRPRYRLTWTSSSGAKQAQRFSDIRTARAALDVVASFPGTKAASLTWKSRRGTRRRIVPDQAQVPATLVPVQTTDGLLYLATDGPVPLLGFAS